MIGINTLHESTMEKYSKIVSVIWMKSLEKPMPLDYSMIDLRKKKIDELNYHLKDFMFMDSPEIQGFSNKVEELVFLQQESREEYEKTIKNFNYAVTKAKDSIIISKRLYIVSYDKELVEKLVSSSVDSIKRVIDEES